MRGATAPAAGLIFGDARRHGRSALVSCRRSTRLIRHSQVLNEGLLLGSILQLAGTTFRPPPAPLRDGFARLDLVATRKDSAPAGKTARSRKLLSGRRA
jgi:hypothetical protein